MRPLCPTATVVIVLTFLCGLLPVIGNLISNTIIVGIAFTISPQVAGGALILSRHSQTGIFPEQQNYQGRIRHPMVVDAAGAPFRRAVRWESPELFSPRSCFSFIKVQASKFAVQDALERKRTYESDGEISGNGPRPSAALSRKSCGPRRATGPPFRHVRRPLEPGHFLSIPGIRNYKRQINSSRS